MKRPTEESCEDEDRDGVMYLQPKLPANHQKLGENHDANSPSQSAEGTNPGDTLTLDFQHPEPRQLISDV